MAFSGVFLTKNIFCKTKLQNKRQKVINNCNFIQKMKNLLQQHNQFKHSNKP